MISRAWTVTIAVAVSLTLSGLAIAQTPTGSIVGLVHDPSGAAVPGARVNAMSLTTRLVRTANTAEQGNFSFPALPAGGYEVSVEAPGFESKVRIAEVQAGTTTTADLILRIGDVKDSVTVNEASPQMQYDSHTVGGVVHKEKSRTFH